MDNPLTVEILAYAPTAFYHCTHCEVAWREMGVSNQFHQEQVRSSLPADLAQDYQMVSDWVKRVFRLHGEQVIIKVIDAASFEGFWKSLRYGVRDYPVVIVDRQARFARSDFEAASGEIARLLTQSKPVESNVMEHEKEV